MNNFFKTTITYPEIDESSGVSKNKSIGFIVEAVNYQDVEKTTFEICDRFGYTDFKYKIDKIKISDLIIDQDNVHISESEDDFINHLSMVSQVDGTPESSTESFGVYKTSFSAYLDDKLKKFNVHIVTINIDRASELCKKFIRKYYGEKGNIYNNKKELESAVLISKDFLTNGKEIFNNLKKD